MVPGDMASLRMIPIWNGQSPAEWSVPGETVRWFLAEINALK